MNRNGMANLRFWRGEDPSNGQRLRRLIVIFYALAAGVIWAAFCFVVFVVFSSNAAFDGRGLTALVVSILPLIMVWLVATDIIKSSRIRMDIRQLSAAVRDLREFQSAQEARTEQFVESMHANPPLPTGDGIGFDEPVESLDAEETGVPDTEDISIGPDSSRPGSIVPTTYLDHYDMSAATLIRALNFADDSEDQAAFEAIKTAMQNSEIASLMGRAHTILLGLANIDIITDELPVDFSEPHFWRISASTLTDKSLLMLGEIKSHHIVDSVSQLLAQNHDFAARVREFIERAMPVIRYLAGELNEVEIELLTGTRCIRGLVLVRQAMEQP